jgi:AraC-like DNA-binding protein
MLCTKHPPIRNLIDLADPSQVRTLTRRLGISRSDLRRIVEKTGNSITAVTKEVELEKNGCTHPS